MKYGARYNPECFGNLFSTATRAWAYPTKETNISLSCCTSDRVDTIKFFA